MAAKGDLAAEQARLEKPSKAFGDLWTQGQEDLARANSNSSGGNVDPASSPVQTRPSPRRPNIYERVIAGERRPRGGDTR